MLDCDDPEITVLQSSANICFKNVLLISVVRTYTQHFQSDETNIIETFVLSFLQLKMF